MDKLTVIQKLKQERLVAVIRMDSQKRKEAIEAIIQGGVHFVEITLTMDQALDTLTYFAQKYAQSDVFIGAGTVLDAFSARLAILQGASFLVSPSFDDDVAKLCNLYRVPYLPGVHNPQDIQHALSSGVDIVKLFPASTLTPSIIKEYKGPFPQADFMISGKVNQQNITQWLQGGATAVCVGSALSNPIKDGADAVSDITKTFVSLAHG